MFEHFVLRTIISVTAFQTSTGRGCVSQVRHWSSHLRRGWCQSNIFAWPGHHCGGVCVYGGGHWSEYKQGRMVGESSANSLEGKTVVQPGGRRQNRARWGPAEFAIFIMANDD